MKFKVKTNDFQKAISSVEGVITVREIKSILSNIKVEAEDGKVFLSATDLEISIKTSVNADTIEPGTTSIPAKQLSNAFKTINFPEALLTNDNAEGNVSTTITDSEKKKDFKMNINGVEGEEIKTISKVDDSLVVDFPCFTISEMIKKTSYSVALEDTRFVFNGLYVISNEGKISFVGTDGRRLAKIDRVIPNALPFSKGVIIPHKAIKEIVKMIDSNDSGKIGIVDNQIYLKIGNVELLCKLIDGNYPDYEAVIPSKSKSSVRINKDELQIALRQALIAAEEPSRQIRMTFSENLLHINSSTPGSTEVNVSLPVDYKGEEMSIAFKGDYLADVIKSIDDAEIIMEFTSSNLPAVFKDPSDPQYTSVIMPMKI
ncbi:MAG TPA: DNA polymerase III subunit beta [Leptospiraceae bacterium]|nr:DNA polymerase III subunit beta [Leptospiraceae bacterium]HMX32567.1 DNA polymerase III subunit beta [Leptospiraceae bacterium]HMY30895.1 DNA polymerase III subunit beta [Leptospiraceae bacterium]HMZ62699.1 DNA polymerase III subunit beta [Leptospiraceae bacterium]HNA09025.1 DNA polymerase III subunit beta [Leptospiraceae bacterium]